MSAVNRPIRSRLAAVRSRIRINRRSFVSCIVTLLLVVVFARLATNAYWRLANDRVAGPFKITVDLWGVPVVDYGYVDGVYVGRQRNPVTVSRTGLDYYVCHQKGGRSCRQLFLNCANWLLDNRVVHNNYAVLEYAFDWPKYGMTSPWRSAMAQGQAIQVLIRAYGLTGDAKYRDAAEDLLNSFFVEVDKGGVTYKTSTRGWWYEEYADEGAQESRVLNGMMFALLGIYEYYEYTEDREAKYLFDQGIVALRTSLRDYDGKGCSYYDIFGNPAQADYHAIHVRLLDRLYDITGEETFRQYRDRWRTCE